MHESTVNGQAKVNEGAAPSAKMPSAAEGSEKARLTRSASRKQKSNGHAGVHAGVNGHGETLPEGARAASDDARGNPNAAAAKSAAAGTDCDACAEAAPAPNGKKQSARRGARAPKENQGESGKGTNPDHSGKTIYIPPGTEPLPADGAGFVDAMHKHVDLYRACARLVQATDEKIAQRMLERLLEMAYGKGPSAQSEDPQIISDMPRPEREQP
jgi:hypothetical protein